MPIPQFKNSSGWKNNYKKPQNSLNNRTKRKKVRNSFFNENLKKNLIYTIVILFLISIITVFSLFFWVSGNLPDPNKLTDRTIAQSTKIYDRTGETILYEIHGEEKRTLVNLEDIPLYVQQATIAIEDKNFYKHNGFSLWAIFRTAVKKVFFGGRAGGSTLTQQFVKNSILTDEYSYIRKLKEVLIAYRLEKKFTKNEILKMYFNEIPYGSTAYGIEAASQKYFSKSVRDINLAEGAVLAALPQAPSRYSPYGSNKDILMGRQQYILDLMVEQNMISKEEAENAKKQEIVFSDPATNIKAPHFVMYVKEILSEKYGEKYIEQGGLKIITSLDLYKQNIAEESIKESADKNLEKYGATNAALLSIDPKTGQILAMVGSKDYFNDEIDGQFNVTTGLRQPGSSIKPMVYAAAFLKGYTPDTILYDVVTNFSLNEDEPYEPHNYNLNELGPVTIRKSLAGSLNIPAVKAIYLAGINNVLDLAQDLGYTTFNDRNRFGLSLVLGGGEVKMIEHVNAYSAFAREGYIRDISVILKIEDSDGNILEEYKEPAERKVLDPVVARQINDILSDNSARSFTFGENNWLNLGNRPVGAKSGTTNDYHDAWTIGYTPSIVTGVWVGNNNNDKMKRGADGGVIAAPIWNNYMKKVLGDTPIEEFKKTDKVITGIPVLDGALGVEEIVKIDKVSGLLATESTPPELIEEKKFFSPHSILYYINKDNPLDKNSNSQNDPQFMLWENAIKKWTEKQASTSIDIITTPPTEFDNIHTIENKPELTITSPLNNQVISLPYLTSSINTTSPRGINKVEYKINNIPLFTSLEYPYSLEKNISFLKNGYHTLTVTACDDALNCSSKEVEFKLEQPFQKELIDPQIVITEPLSGIAISNYSFPLKINLNLTNPEYIGQIKTYYKNSNNEIITISSIPYQENLNITWNEIPSSGDYIIFSEILTWDNKIIKSNEVAIIVNNQPESLSE